MVMPFLLLHAAEEKRVVYDLTTGSLELFERNILKGIVMNKGYFEQRFEELHVSVVIHGDAYRFFVKEPEKSIYKKDAKLLGRYKDLHKRLQSLHENYDVEFLMCGAAMLRKKLKKEQIVAFVKVIPNSTLGLIERQNEGYAYIPVR